MALKQRIGIFSLVFIIATAIDQLTKIWARSHFADDHRDNWLGGLWQMFLTENHGAMLGLGGNLDEHTRFLIFTVGVSIFLVVATWYCLKHFKSWIELACAGMLVSGGASNLYDRLMQNGGVTDFLFMDFGFARTGVFNVADMFIMAAVFIYLIRELKVEYKAYKARKADKQND